MRITTQNPQSHYLSIDKQDGSWKPQDVLDYRLKLLSPDIIDTGYMPKKKIKIPTIVEPTPTKVKEEMPIKRRKKRSLNRMVNLNKLLEVNKFEVDK
jgi:hypothetical protein